MSKKIVGNYVAADASKALKNVDRIGCTVTDDGTIYVFSGYFIFKMLPQEYAAIAQPVVHCEAGDWMIDKHGKRDGRGLDAAKIFSDSVNDTLDLPALKRCPLFARSGKESALHMEMFFSEERDFAAFYNTAYISALAPDVTWKAPDAMKSAIAYANNEPFALVLPIRPDEKLTRSVKAYFVETNDKAADASAEKLRRHAEEMERIAKQREDENSRIRRELEQAQSEIAALREQIAQQTAVLAAAQEAQQAAQDAPAESKPEPKAAADQIVARFADMGITATIKGAQTSAPVVWLSGDTKKHAAEIEAAGAVWSSKKRAYYYRVA